MAAAALLSRDGHRITVFERFEAPRPLGSGLMLQPTGLAVLHQLGLAEKAIAAGERIERLHGEARGRVVLDVQYSALRARMAFGVGIHRAALFSLINEELVASGVTTATGHEVAGVERDAGGISLRFQNGCREGPFDLVIDALGTRSVLSPDRGRDLRYGALWTNLSLPDGFDPHALTQRYRRASIMAGVLPIGRLSWSGPPLAAFFWSLRDSDYPDWRERGLDRWKEEVCDLWPEARKLVDQIVSAETLTFARYAHKTLRQPVEERLIHIGDSWHSASPQLGQGANMALLDAYALTTALRERSEIADALCRTAQFRRSHVQLYQWLTAVLTPVYQSDSRLIPLLRDWLMGPASKLWPFTAFQAALVSGLVGSPLRRLGIGFAPAQTGR